MAGSENSLVGQLIQKLGLHREDRLQEKSTELLRLLELKSSRTGSTINEYAKTLICIDLATTTLGITFDSDIGLKLSGLRKSAYTNYKRTFEKILELNKPAGINEICVQLGLHELKKKATQFLNTYRNFVGENADEVDITHPQYAAMAVFQACKFGKVKAMKPKLMGYSHLRPSQWNQLEQQWNKLLMTHEQEELKESKKITQDKVQATTKIVSNAIKQSKGAIDVEDYEVWKKRMLDYAYEKLKTMANE